MKILLILLGKKFSHEKFIIKLIREWKFTIWKCSNNFNSGRKKKHRYQIGSTLYITLAVGQWFSMALRLAIYEWHKRVKYDKRSTWQCLAALKTAHNYHIVRQILLVSQNKKSLLTIFTSFPLKFMEQYIFHINDEKARMEEKLNHKKAATFQYIVTVAPLLKRDRNAAVMFLWHHFN